MDWFGGIELSSVELVQTDVETGYGIGVTVDLPKMKYHPTLRMLPLEGFEPVTFGMLWQGRRTSLLDALIKTVEAAAKELASEQSPGAWIQK